MEEKNKQNVHSGRRTNRQGAAVGSSVRIGPMRRARLCRKTGVNKVLFELSAGFSVRVLKSQEKLTHATLFLFITFKHYDMETKKRGDWIGCWLVAVNSFK